MSKGRNKAELQGTNAGGEKGELTELSSFTDELEVALESVKVSKDFPLETYLFNNPLSNIKREVAASHEEKVAQQQPKHRYSMLEKHNGNELKIEIDEG